MIEYVISDGRGRYMRRDFSGKFRPVGNQALADTWQAKDKAENVLKNQINKNLRTRYKVVEITNEKIMPVKKEYIDKFPIRTEEPKPSKIKIENYQLDKWVEEINSFSDFVFRVEERKKLLSNDLSIVDKEILDIEHYIEFGKFNAYEGWLAFSMLRHRLQKRRNIKNEQYILSLLKECKFDSETITDIQNSIQGLRERIYTPRVLTELFE